MLEVVISVSLGALKEALEGEFYEVLQGASLKRELKREGLKRGP